MSEYLISDLIFQFFSLLYGKKFKVFSKKRSLDISLQHKNEASYKFSKKKLLHLSEKRAGDERVNSGDLKMMLRLLTLVLFICVKI